MKQKVFENIEKSISTARLSTYRNHSENNTHLVANYILNAKISENFYFLLQNLEVSLRNAIYGGFKKHYPSRNFFYLHETNPRYRYQRRQEKHDRECWKMLCGAKYQLRNTRINDGKIIAIQYDWGIDYDALVGVKETAHTLTLPNEFNLSQNYPNPFNPSTTIEFSLPKSEYIELKVYNILGKEVSTLVSKKLNQGNHTYQFDGKNLASGVYYYQLVAGDYREVKKMILLR